MNKNEPQEPSCGGCSYSLLLTNCPLLITAACNSLSELSAAASRPFTDSLANKGTSVSLESRGYQMAARDWPESVSTQRFSVLSPSAKHFHVTSEIRMNTSQHIDVLIQQSTFLTHN
jgi:hypothetical protein